MRRRHVPLGEGGGGHRGQVRVHAGEDHRRRHRRLHRRLPPDRRGQDQVAHAPRDRRGPLRARLRRRHQATGPEVLLRSVEKM